MRKFIARRLVTIPLIYILIIIGIFVLQFTTGIVFSYSFGSFKVSGSYEKTENAAGKLEFPLHLTYKGIDVCIDSKTPVLAETAAGTAEIFPDYIIENDDGVTLQFPGAVSIAFSAVRSPESDDEIFSIKADFPENGVTAVSLPYRLPKYASTAAEDGMILISYDNLQYMFSGSIDYDTQHIRLSGYTPQAAYLRYIPFQGIDLHKIAATELASSALYDKNRAAFAAAAIAELKTSLTGLYTESGVVAYIAEMARTGNYRNALTAVPVTFAGGADRTYLSNTFLDSLVKTHESLAAKNRTETHKLRQLLSEQSPAVFETENLVPFLLNHLNAASFTQLRNMLAALDTSSLTALQAAGILELAVQVPRYYPDMQPAVAAKAGECLDILFNSLVQTGDGLFISSDGKTVAVMDSLKISRILIEYGALYNNDEWAAAGRALFNSIAAFMRERANVPVRFTFLTASDGVSKSGVIPEAGTSIPADLLYPYIVDSPYYPREICLAGYRPGIWAWTSARSISVRTLSSVVVEIDVSFIDGETHYMVISGIRPFTRIQLYDMDFRTDPRFENYNSSGYVYNPATETLYLKMRHKAPVETIRLFYEPAPRPEPVPEPAPAAPEPDTAADSVAPETEAAAAPVPAE